MLSVSLFTAYGAGFLSSLSPCIYPMLPITISFLTKESSDKQSAKKYYKIISFFLGQVLAFTTLGLVAVWAGEIFGFSSQSFSVNITVAILMAIFAISTLEKFQPFFAKISNLMPKKSVKDVNLFTAFILGATSALIASPCTSPVLGGILSKIASEGSLVSGIFQMLAFSFGMGSIFLILGLGLLKSNKIPRSGSWMNLVHKFTVILLVASSLYYFYLACQAY